jgi:transmembrane sensor
MDKEKLIELAHRVVTGNATEQEKNELHQWYDSMADTDEEAVVVTQSEETTAAVGDRMLQRMLAQINEESQPAAVIPIWKRYKLHWAAVAVAASLLIGVIYFNQKPGTEREMAVQTERFKNDIAPGGNHATLTLADGSSIVLDSIASGTIATQGNTQITEAGNGQLVYNAGAASDALLYNTVATPVGGQYQLVLPDGSKVWLNAKSSLRFPAAFKGNQRKVMLSGEAYFEVAKVANSRFSVEVMKDPATQPTCNVEVLGTHFNIKAYDDEPLVKTTLLEGSVKLTTATAGKEQILKPGEQAAIGQAGNIEVLQGVDVDESVAWKNGLFKFKELSIEEIMQQAKRWYDIEVVYEADIKDHFISTIPRQSTAIQFLSILEKTGSVQFKIEGKKVTVLAAK